MCINLSRVVHACLESVPGKGMIIRNMIRSVVVNGVAGLVAGPGNNMTLGDGDSW